MHPDMRTIRVVYSLWYPREQGQWADALSKLNLPYPEPAMLYKEPPTPLGDGDGRAVHVLARTVARSALMQPDFRVTVSEFFSENS